MEFTGLASDCDVSGIGRRRQLRNLAIETPTLLVVLAIYGAWLALTWWHAVLAWPVLALLGGATVAWHGSLQHETIHGHPTGVRWIDASVGAVPLSLWLPYSVYRRSHLGHHAKPAITDPLDDPESNYLTRDGGIGGLSARLESTLLGRLVLGPPIRLARFLIAELSRARRRPAEAARDWALHGLAAIPLLWWLDRAGLSIGTYVLLFVYPGTSLSLLRSFAEHRANRDPQRRAAIIERPGVFGLLFLNNNLHAVHHAWPRLAWYRLPEHFRRHRRDFAAAPHYRGYGEIGRRFAWRPQDGVVHPDYRGSAESR